MGQQKPPAAPNAAQDFAQGIQTWEKYLPGMLNKEDIYRGATPSWLGVSQAQFDSMSEDQKRVMAQQRLQQFFGPIQQQQQLSALQNLDPNWYAMHGLLGSRIGSDLTRGYVDPQQAMAYNALGQRVQQNLAQGGVDPTQIAQYQNLGQYAGQALGAGRNAMAQSQALMGAGALTPEQAAAYKALGQGTTADYNRGSQMDPILANQVQQAIAARQSATGQTMGNAAQMAAAVYTGQRAQQLQQQRTGNLQNYLGLSNPAAQAAQIAQGYGQLAQGYGQTGIGFQNVAAPELAAMQGASVYSQLQSPAERAVAEAGSYLSSPGVPSMINQIQGVVPDRSFAYMNPNAGYMGQQYGLQNYANQVYAQGPQQNPWMGALSGALSGAQTGSMFGPYGAAGGAIIGGVGGYASQGGFSDPKMKTDVKKVGSVPIYEYRYKARFGIPGTFRGPMSTDVKKHAPEAVTKLFGHDFVRSPNRLGLSRVKVKEE